MWGGEFGSLAKELRQCPIPGNYTTVWPQSIGRSCKNKPREGEKEKGTPLCRCVNLEFFVGGVYLGNGILKRWFPTKSAKGGGTKTAKAAHSVAVR